MHGITAEDVEQAPTFSQIVGDVLSRLDHAVFVAHNAHFDHEFLAAELSMAGVFAPAIPILCTLSLAYRLYPGLTNHQLGACCEAAGLVHEGSHEALTDARADARLLLVLLQLAQARGLTTLQSLGCSEAFPATWPALPGTGLCCRRHGRAKPDIPYLARMVASLGPVHIEDERTARYLNLLDRVLEDGIVTEAEAESLGAMAEQLGLSRDEVLVAHERYLESLIDAALADGRVTEIERRDLEAATRLLCIDPASMHAMLSQARRARDQGPVLKPAQKGA